ncbi:MAG: hypothetical protein GX161_08540 [Firmicutes bacterium]|jgi:hypothetical protein|nr:hypothetical protein [Bacillota bacterium]
MTDQDLMNAALTALKHQSHVYHGLTEHTANEGLLREISTLLNEKQSMRLRVFEAMNRRGWYNPQLISQAQLDQHKQRMNQTFQQLQQAPAYATGPAQSPGISHPGITYQAWGHMPHPQAQQPAWQGAHGPH